MKTLSRFFFALPALLCCFTVQAQTPAPSAPAPAPAATSDATQAPAAAQQSVDPAKVEEIRKFIQLAGTAKQMDILKGRMITMFKNQRPDVSEAVWARVENKMDINDLLEKLIPLYDKYYTLDDLKAVNAFYGSPIGQKMVTANAQIAQESMAIGQEWGRATAMQLERELVKEKQDEAAAQPTAPATAPASVTTPPMSAPAPAAK